MCSISRTWERAWEDTNTPDRRGEREQARQRLCCLTKGGTVTDELAELCLTLDTEMVLAENELEIIAPENDAGETADT